MSIDMVIARYNERIDWINKIKNKDIHILLYNKGNPVPLSKKYETILLPNVGRESHTYLTHIINHYDHLADTTIFTQGDPFDHSPDFLQLLNHISLFEPIQPLSLCYSIEEQIPPLYFIEESKYLWIKKNKINVVYADHNLDIQYPFSFFETKWIYPIKEKFNQPRNFLEYIAKRYDLEKDISCDVLLPFSFGAIFSVTKKIIQERPITFYKKLLDLLLQDIFGVEEFPTTSKQLDILKYKPSQRLNISLIENG
jgi:hypothetical protein